LLKVSQSTSSGHGPTEILKSTPAISQLPEVLSALLLGLALVGIQVLIGGTRLLFSLPSYGLLAVIGCFALLSLRVARSRPDQLCLISAAIFFGYVILRALLSPVPYLARADLYSVLGAIIVYFFTACLFTGTKARYSLIVVLLGVAMVHVVIGATQFRHGTNFMPIPWLQRFDYGWRASGFYICPNHLAGLLEVLGIFGLSLVCWSRWATWAKLIVGYEVAVCYLGIALTGSRGGYLSTLTSLLVFGFLSLLVLRQASAFLFRRVGSLTLIAAILLCGATAFLMKKSDFLTGRAQNVFETTNVRFDLWQAAIQQWKLDPLFGTGSGTYLYYGREFRTDRMQLDPIQVHNDYLHLLAEYGLLGAAGFLIFLGCHLRRGWKEFQRLGPKRISFSQRLPSNGLALNIGALAAVAAYLVHSVFDFNLHIPANVLVLAFAFGILANAGITRGQSPPPVTTPLLLWRLTLPILGLIVTIQCVRLLPGEYFAERSRTSLRDHRPTSAIHFALRGLEWEQANPDLYLYLGRARMEHGEWMLAPEAAMSYYRAALTAFEAARSLAPRDVTLVLQVAFAYDALGRFTEAEWLYYDALALDPKSTHVRNYYQAHLGKWGKQAPSR
jgi:O-antigen ligase